MKSRPRRIFKGRIISLYTGEKVIPGGKRAYFEQVRHPGAVLVVPFHGKKTIFIRQYRGVIEKYIWELPAGLLEKGEKASACARRELREETGYIATNIKRLGHIYTSPGFCDERITIYRAECMPGTATDMDDDEVIRTRAFTRNDIRAMFDSGRINDSKTIAGLCFAGLL